MNRVNTAHRQKRSPLITAARWLCVTAPLSSVGPLTNVCPHQRAFEPKPNRNHYWLKDQRLQVGGVTSESARSLLNQSQEILSNYPSSGTTHCDMIPVTTIVIVVVVVVVLILLLFIYSMNTL